MAQIAQRACITTLSFLMQQQLDCDENVHGSLTYFLCRLLGPSPSMNCDRRSLAPPPGYGSLKFMLLNHSVVGCSDVRLPTAIAALFNFALFAVGFPLINFLPRDRTTQSALVSNSAPYPDHQNQNHKPGSQAAYICFKLPSNNLQVGTAIS